LTLILKFKKSLSSKIFIFLKALLTNASGQGSLNSSKISFSREPAFTPILIEQLLFLAALIISHRQYPLAAPQPKLLAALIISRPQSP